MWIDHDWTTIGKFDTPSGQIVVSDPGYDKPSPKESKEIFSLNLAFHVPKTTWKAKIKDGRGAGEQS